MLLQQIRDLIPIWIKQARIPVRPKHHAIKQLEKHFQSWKDLKRFRNRQALAQKKKEKTFVDSLDDLFVISHANALDMIVNPEDKSFYLANKRKDGVVVWDQWIRAWRLKKSK